MTTLGAISLGILGLLSGLLIGAIGVGGVVLVPALVYFGGIPIHAAIAAAMMSYVFTGLIGTLVYTSKNSIRWSMAAWLCAGAMPAALAEVRVTNLFTVTFSPASAIPQTGQGMSRWSTM